MPDTILPDLADLRRDLMIGEIKSTIVDVPTVRKHKLSSLSVTAQSYVIVELRLGNGEGAQDYIRRLRTQFPDSEQARATDATARQ